MCSFVQRDNVREMVNRKETAMLEPKSVTVVKRAKAVPLSSDLWRVVLNMTVLTSQFKVPITSFPNPCLHHVRYS